VLTPNFAESDAATPAMVEATLLPVNERRTGTLPESGGNRLISS